MLEALRQLSWARAGRGDRISNVLLYLPLGFCLFLWLDTRLRRGAAIAARDRARHRSLSLAIEVAQVYVSIRVPSLTDLTLNRCGTRWARPAGWRGVRMAPSDASAEPRREAAARSGRRAADRRCGWRGDSRHSCRISIWQSSRPLCGRCSSPQLDPVAISIYLTCWLVVNQASPRW